MVEADRHELLGPLALVLEPGSERFVDGVLVAGKVAAGVTAAELRLADPRWARIEELDGPGAVPLTALPQLRVARHVPQDCLLEALASRRPLALKHLHASVSLHGLTIDGAEGVLPEVEELRLDTVSAGDLAALSPLAALPALRRLTITASAKAVLSLGWWGHVAAGRSLQYVDLVMVDADHEARCRLVAKDKTVRLAVDNTNWEAFDLTFHLEDVRVAQFTRIVLSRSPTLDQRLALQRRARALAIALSIPPVEKPLRS